MAFKRLILLCIAAVGALTAAFADDAAAVADGEDAAVLTVEQAQQRLASMPLHDIEGIWQLTADGATVAIWRDDAAAQGVAQYTVTVLESPVLTVMPGTVMGTITPTAQPHTFDASLLTDFDPGTLKLNRPRPFTLKLEDRAHLSFRRVNTGIRLSPIILFPYFMRRGMKIGSDRPDDLDGAIKLYPPTPVAGQPRYL